MPTPNQVLAARAVELLDQAGYQAVASQCGDFVTVQDPVWCSSGLRNWSETRPVRLPINAGNLRTMWRFIDARS